MARGIITTKLGGVLTALALVAALVWLFLELRPEIPANLERARSEIHQDAGGLSTGASPEGEASGTPPGDAGERHALEAEEVDPPLELTEGGPRCRIQGQVVTWRERRSSGLRSRFTPWAAPGPKGPAPTISWLIPTPTATSSSRHRFQGEVEVKAGDCATCRLERA